ncbi:ligand-binding sensor domain-containing protein [Fluviicola taffensis]|uniref:Integral membrane sensor signal transduction histidine kinase n=1 Tax=Fluviicola taffensis (strain DSM 16823 / NCIMB 13979 / RW262) TaxID=755732 RepID=F2IJC7_FLUTR|nr:sensor histidine kinase [Fluviicola taffensis]AEA46024.1 integral membrane sensor signal transduction histidine kinase [Fluviicola taffensis DSM 16823]
MVKLNQNYGLLYRNYILCLFLFIGFGVWTQSNTGQFINYGVKDGLCEPVCSGIVQDSRGFYWVSTQGGINRFDGTNFKCYFPSEMLGEKQLLDNSRVFFEIAPNQLILTLGNSKAFILNCISPDLKPIQCLKNRNALDIERIDKNRVSVSSIDTVFILNNELEIIQTIAPPTQEKGLGIQLKMISESKCLISSSKEFFFFDFKTAKFKSFKPQIRLEGLLNTGYQLLHVDQENHWIYLVNYFMGLVQVNYQGNVIHAWDELHLNTDLSGLPNKIVVDKNNPQMVWISGNKGFSHFNLLSHKAINYFHDPNIPLSLADNQINNLYLDRYQNLWVTTYKGLSILNKNSTLISEWNLSISSDEPLMNICRISPNELLATKYYDGVYQINEKRNQFDPFYSKELHGSWFVFKDGIHVVHGGKGADLQLVNLQTNQVSKLSFLKPYFKQSDVVVLGFRHSSGNWWFSGNVGGGLVRYHPKSHQITHFSRAKSSFSGSYFTSYSEAPNGDLWFSSNKTQILTHWIQAEDRFEEINFAYIFEKQHQSIIQCVKTDNRGNVWIAFEGSGLVRYVISTKKITIFGKKEGIPSNFIYNLVFDDQERLWVGTKKGLACLEVDLRTAHFFGVENGFPSEHFDQSSYFDYQTQMVWIASDNYLLRFSPDKLLKTKRLELKLFVDEFLVSNVKQSLENTSNYDFSPIQNTIQLTFSTINALGKHQIEYSYFLEGSSETWVSLGTNSSVFFPSLPSGKYQFRLRAKIPGTKKWFYLKNPIRFVIATPWYLTWWFKILIVLASSGVIFLVTRIYFLRKIEKQRAILEKQLAVQNERDRIAYDMHDDLGSGLTKISYLSKEALRKSENQAELNRINNTSVELVNNMSELIWAMKVENDSLLDLMSYLRHYAMEYFETNQIEIQMELDELLEDRRISGEVRRQVFLIFKEALHNIVKHAHTKRVYIQIQVTEKMRILIRDYGVGFQVKEGRASGNGMKTMQNRTNKLNGVMKLESSEEGVELIVEFPLSTED